MGEFERGDRVTLADGSSLAVGSVRGECGDGTYSVRIGLGYRRVPASGLVLVGRAASGRLDVVVTRYGEIIGR